MMKELESDNQDMSSDISSCVEGISSSPAFNTMSSMESMVGSAPTGSLTV